MDALFLFKMKLCTTNLTVKNFSSGNKLKVGAHITAALFEKKGIFLEKNLQT